MSGSGYATGKKPKDTRVGAVIVFRPGTDVAKAQKFLDAMLERDIIEPTEARAFNGDYGTPVWYVP